MPIGPDIVFHKPSLISTKEPLSPTNKTRNTVYIHPMVLDVEWLPSKTSPKHTPRLEAQWETTCLQDPTTRLDRRHCQGSEDAHISQSPRRQTHVLRIPNLDSDPETYVDNVGQRDRRNDICVASKALLSPNGRLGNL